ncbi:MAG: Acetyltransferase (GNAT) domain-containing protein [Glomeribacter sp. 1016415]|nr:Acetyltransferase (GNAT) domain-containing protein [Glomeribacter sp. 1016415]
MLEEQLLDPHCHDRQAFSSGVVELDEYLHRFAVQQSKKGIAVVRVVVDTDMPKTILGYYSLSAAQIDAVQMDERTQQKLPRYPVPCFRLGRLAAHSAHRGRGLGRLLLGCAVERCLEAKKHVAAYALVVDAKGEDAKFFYEHYGFISCRDNPMTLYLSLGA